MYLVMYSIYKIIMIDKCQQVLLHTDKKNKKNTKQIKAILYIN